MSDYLRIVRSSASPTPYASPSLPPCFPPPPTRPFLPCFLPHLLQVLHVHLQLLHLNLDLGLGQLTGCRAPAGMHGEGKVGDKVS